MLGEAILDDEFYRRQNFSEFEFKLLDEPGKKSRGPVSGAVIGIEFIFPF